MEKYLSEELEPKAFADFSLLDLKELASKHFLENLASCDDRETLIFLIQDLSSE